MEQPARRSALCLEQLSKTSQTSRVQLSVLPECKLNSVEINQGWDARNSEWRVFDLGTKTRKNPSSLPVPDVALSDDNTPI